MITVTNAIEPQSICLGCIAAMHLDFKNGLYINAALKNRIKIRKKQELPKPIEANRLASRNMLRNGSYKPTGRGKPANEFLLKMSQNDTFPIINPLVDLNNYISLTYMFPISIIDLDKSPTSEYAVQLGSEDENYIFNPSGQTIDLKDLVTGFAIDTLHNSRTPLFNPIKDSMLTKTSDETNRVLAVIYSDNNEASKALLRDAVKEFQELLETISQKTENAIINFGEIYKFII